MGVQLVKFLHFSLLLSLTALIFHFLVKTFDVKRIPTFALALHVQPIVIFRVYAILKAPFIFFDTVSEASSVVVSTLNLF